MPFPRRQFLQTLIGTPLLAASAFRLSAAEEYLSTGISLGDLQPGEDLFGHIRRVKGKFDSDLYRQILGAANEFKEGDQAIGVSAINQQTRSRARELLANTRVDEFGMHEVFQDGLSDLLASREVDTDIPYSQNLSFGQLKDYLLKHDEQQIKTIAASLSSDAIGCLVKLMTNKELIAVGQKVFHPLPGSQIGAKGYLGARVQPNSPTDNLEDIRWQVFDAWSYAVGDVVLGNNPVSSHPESVAAIELALKDLLTTFGVADLLPQCVLSHIDVQAEVERSHPGSTALWFQSIAGCDAANQTFDISLNKMLRYAQSRTGKYGLYFETGQGADFTNGHSHGFDMVLHESRKYGFARVLKEHVAQAQKAAGKTPAPWVHLNDVAGFIGPEIFRTREQLVRCCLEDIVMGKLHGLTIGLDVCSTLHMDVSLDDLDWCLDQIMPANPAYLMALPTKIDPMLGYLTTGYQDHVRLREKFGYKVNDGMWAFFQELGVIDADGKPTKHFGDPLWVYLQYRHRKGDTRTDEAILAEGRSQMLEIRNRGVFLAEGHGKHPGDLTPSLNREIHQIYDDAKESIWAELTPAFVASVPDHILLKTQSIDREDYILHPTSGEVLSAESAETVRKLRAQYDGQFDVQIVVSDGLNALSIMDEGHLDTFLKTVRSQLAAAGYRPAKENLVVISGRVRAGYRIGEQLFENLPGHRAILHIIGERPGTGHHTFSVYMTAPAGNVWSQAGKVDHNITKVVSGIATTALAPAKGAEETVRLLQKMAPV